MERIRLGLAGLGAILMIVFVASAGMRSSTPEPKTETPGETLSVLGVAPNMDEDGPGGPAEAEPAAR